MKLPTVLRTKKHQVIHDSELNWVLLWLHLIMRWTNWLYRTPKLKSDNPLPNSLIKPVSPMHDEVKPALVYYKTCIFHIHQIFANRIKLLN